MQGSISECSARIVENNLLLRSADDTLISGSSQQEHFTMSSKLHNAWSNMIFVHVSPSVPFCGKLWNI